MGKPDCSAGLERTPRPPAYIRRAPFAELSGHYLQQEIMVHLETIGYCKCPVPGLSLLGSCTLVAPFLRTQQPGDAARVQGLIELRD
jgi:hypothetical protein